jgi:hypothetical protein
VPRTETTRESRDRTSARCSCDARPYTDVPRIFYVERDVSNPSGYRRSVGITLGWGTYHTLSIWPHNPGSIYNDYYFFVDGELRGSTVYLHQRFNEAYFAGVVYQGGHDPYCTEMYASAVKSGSPWSSVQACSAGPVPPPCDWHLFFDNLLPDWPYSIYLQQNGLRATPLAWGPLP